ncbi:hypothetical protein [Bremerella cremea]|uniref:hypothetical protein n=1 Tax=Bremerella cremea TaxID=1031537 RepID=UPI0031E77B76
MLTWKQMELLNRVAALHHRSLPTYLAYARPWVALGGEANAHVIEDIAADHHDVVERVLEVLETADRPVSLGDFPMEYTSLNDLSLDFVLGEVTRFERRLLHSLEDIATWLDRESTATRLVNLAIGMAKGHLQNLAELTKSSSSRSAS